MLGAGEQYEHMKPFCGASHVSDDEKQHVLGLGCTRAWDVTAVWSLIIC